MGLMLQWSELVTCPGPPCFHFYYYIFVLYVCACVSVCVCVHMYYIISQVSFGHRYQSIGVKGENFELFPNSMWMIQACSKNQSRGALKSILTVFVRQLFLLPYQLQDNLGTNMDWLRMWTLVAISGKPTKVNVSWIQNRSGIDSAASDDAFLR